MKKIKLFLGSSIGELEADRTQVGDFVRQLNEVYFDRGIHFTLIKCEDYDNAIGADGKQSEYDREICDSDLCFFLFHKKVGAYTRHEFDVALAAFRAVGRPKIVTYFKRTPDDDPTPDDVAAFMALLDGEIKHYYNTYQYIDSLKLGILMQIKLMRLDAEEPRIADGKILLGETVVADLGQLPVFASNETLGALREQLRALTAEFTALRLKRIDAPEDEALYAAFADVAARKEDVEQQLRDLEKAVLKATEVMAEKTSAGNLSPRQVAAWRAFEKGDCSAALEILDLDAILADLAHNEQSAEGYRERIRTNVNELLQRVEMMQADGVDRDEAAEIERIYTTVCDRVETYSLDKAPLYDFAAFLSDQNEPERALAIAQKLAYYQADPSAPASPADRMRLLNLSGFLASTLNRLDEAERDFTASSDLANDLVKQDPTYLASVANNYLNLAEVCVKRNRFDKAEAILRSALKVVAPHLRTSDPDLLARMQAKLGEVCATLLHFEEAEVLLKRAIVTESTAKKPDDEIGNMLATIRYSLGGVYVKIRRFDKAEAVLHEAEAQAKKLAEMNPDRFEPLLAEIDWLLSTMYATSMRAQPAFDAAQAAVGLMSRLARKNPDRFEPRLAEGLLALGTGCRMLGQNKRAEHAFLSALALADRLYQKDPEAFEPIYAKCHTLLGVQLMTESNFAGDATMHEQAKQTLLEATASAKRLSEKNPDAFDVTLSLAYTMLGSLYSDDETEDGYAAAEQVYLDAVAILERLSDQNPSAFRPTLASIYSLLANMYEEQAQRALSDEETWASGTALAEKAIRCDRKLIDLYDALENKADPIIDAGDCGAACVSIADLRLEIEGEDADDPAPYREIEALLLKGVGLLEGALPDTPDPENEIDTAFSLALAYQHLRDLCDGPLNDPARSAHYDALLDRLIAAYGLDE